MAKKYKPLRYFYLNGQLHKSLFINRAADKITTWCYPLGKRVAYTYSDVKRNKQPAFNMTQVGQMLDKTRKTLEWAILDGNIPAPQHAYTIDQKRAMIKYLWSEEDIMNAHAYFMTVHRGRPRADGRINPSMHLTARELRAMIHQEEILYVRTDDGEFVPTWRAENY